MFSDCAVTLSRPELEKWVASAGSSESKSSQGWPVETFLIKQLDQDRGPLKRALAVFLVSLESHPAKMARGKYSPNRIVSHCASNCVCLHHVTPPNCHEELGPHSDPRDVPQQDSWRIARYIPSKKHGHVGNTINSVAYDATPRALRSWPGGKPGAPFGSPRPLGD